MNLKYSSMPRRRARVEPEITDVNPIYMRDDQLEALAKPLDKSGYGQYLRSVLSERLF
jgi:dTDP-glucose pyrophosphorylase